MKKYAVLLLLPLLLLVFSQNAVTAGSAGSYQPLPEALEALNGDETVDTTNASDFYYAFEPKQGTPSKGFIIYPGGKVDPRSYAPTAHAIAAKGYIAVIVRMPLDIAFLGYKRANIIMRKYPEIKTWAIGGHSLGGVGACDYAQKYTEKIAGVVLWASYPSSSFSLRDTNLKVISVYGTKDGLTDAKDIADSHQDLPEDTIWVEIKGGNHTQFGYYWDGKDENFLQPDDNPADISRAAQQEIIINATADFLEDM